MINIEHKNILESIGLTTEIENDRYVAYFGDWKIHHQNYYWVARIGEKFLGLKLEDATKLYEINNPETNKPYGKIIRAGCDGNGLHPSEYVSQPIYNDELDKKLEAIGYEKVYSELMNIFYIPINLGEVAKLCNEEKLKVQRYVKDYHIDTDKGLSVFVDFVIHLKREEKLKRILDAQI